MSNHRDSFDVVVLGGGSAGEVVTTGLASAGVSVAISELSDTSRGFLADKAGQPSQGRVELYADEDRGVLVGAAALGPDADSWAGELAVMVRAEVPVDMLADVVHAFPTWGAAVEVPLRALRDRRGLRRPA